MAYCRTALLVHLIFCLLRHRLIGCAAEPAAFVSTETPISTRRKRSSGSDVPVAETAVIEGGGSQQQLEHGHGMTASLTRAAAAAAAATTTPATATATTAVAALTSLPVLSLRRSGQRCGWLYSSGIGSCGVSSSTNSTSTNRKNGIGRRRALSGLAPAVGPSTGGAAFWGATVPSGGEALSAPTSSLAHRGRCRPAARPPPLRFSIVMPNNLKESFAPAQGNPGATPDKPLGDAGPTSETGCGGGEGGMTSSFTWLDSVNSTMDEVKTLIVNQQGSSAKGVFAVAAREQLRGRGTKGRAWIGLPGNVFLTVAVPLDQVPVPLSLIPLRVGTLIAPEIQRRLKRQELPVPPGTDEGQRQQQQQQQQEPLPSLFSSSEQGIDSSNSRVSLKWPNDVLIGGSKVAGVLIEAELPFLLVGIGVNVRHKPDVPRQGPHRGRTATCLADFGADTSDEAVRELSAALTEKLCSWASGTDSADAALSEWSRWVDWSLPLEIRDEGRAVTPIGVAPDGRLRVVDPATKKEELLATEYLL